jgi:hypothetical protein
MILSNVPQKQDGLSSEDPGKEQKRFKPPSAGDDNIDNGVLQLAQIELGHKNRNGDRGTRRRTGPSARFQASGLRLQASGYRLQKNGFEFRVQN